MKILLVSPHFPPRLIGGVEIYTKRIADTLRSLGDRPEVISLERVDAEQGGVRIVTDTEYGYPVHRLHAHPDVVGRPLGMIYDSPDIQRAIERILDASPPDVLHLHSGYLLGGDVLGAALRRRIPTVVTLHDFWFICPRVTLIHPSGRLCTGPDTPEKCAWCLSTEQRRYRVPDGLTGGLFGRAMVTALSSQSVAALMGKGNSIQSLAARRETLIDRLSRADVILSPSHFLLDEVVRAGFPRGRILVSRYGIDAQPVKRRERKTADLRVGYLGQIAPHKGVHLLIEAARHLSSAPIAVRIYGDPAPHPLYTKRLRRLAHGDARIAFQGPYQHGGVYDILADLDVIVVPSVWYENAPFVIQEAQAAGVPVLASRLGGMRELVSDGQNGLLFDAGNARDLAERLQRILDDPALLERLRPRADIVRTAEHEIRELRDHYRRLLG